MTRRVARGDLATVAPGGARAPAFEALVVGDATLGDLVREAVDRLSGSVLVRVSMDDLDDAQGEGCAVAVVDLRFLDSTVVEQLDRRRPDVAVVAIVPAGGTRLAAEAIKNGATEVAEWPVTSAHLSEILRRLGNRDRRVVEPGYAERIEAARCAIRARALSPAEAQLRRALTIEVLRPEALNLLGVIARARGALHAAQVWWRMALDVDPAYAPARDNLIHATRRPGPTGPLRLD